MFGTIFHDTLDSVWEEARGHLREELEQVRGMMQNNLAQFFPMPAQTLFGRNSVKPGDPSPVTISQALDWLGE